MALAEESEETVVRFGTVGPGVRRRLWLGGMCVVGLVAAGLTAAVVFDGDTSYPDEWDSRILPLVQFVERERDSTFKHPVQVDFLTPDEYSERTRTDESSLEDEDLEDLKQAEALLRAFGLITSDVDLLETVNELSDTGTLAHYDIEEERVTVRGTDVTPDLRVTLVHELTHVLQDQRFDLDRFEEGDDELSSGQTMAFRALVEGDADRIEAAYVESLSEDEERAVDESHEDAESKLEAEEASQAVAALFAVPYVLGDGFVDLLDKFAVAKVDEAYADPPVSEEQVLDPFAYLHGDQPRAVATPAVDGSEVLDDGDFGAASLLVVLAERIDLREALRAAIGWGGDAYAVFERGGQTCARVAVSGDTPADTDEIDGALRAWAGAAPSGTATVNKEEDLVEVESCDPGSRVTPGSGGSVAALSLAAGRTQIAVEAMEQGAQLSEARCYATGVVNEIEMELAEEAFEQLFDAARAIAERCRED